MSFCPGKIFNFVPDNGARNVSIRSHPWIACRRRAQRPSVLCHDLFNGVIRWVKTQENIALTQETGPGVYTTREVLIQLPSVKGLKGGRWKTCEKGDRDYLRRQAFGSLRMKNSEAKILLVQSFKELKSDSTGSSNSKSFSATKITGTD
jgi:hypothetical protein